MTAPKKTAAERAKARRAKGIAKSSKRRSKTTRRRSLKEVRVVLRDAATILHTYARLEKREDARMVSHLLFHARRLVAKNPLDRDALGLELSDLVRRLFVPWYGHEEGVEAVMVVPANAKGLEMLQWHLGRQSAMQRELDLTAHRTATETVNASGGQA